MSTRMAVCGLMTVALVFLGGPARVASADGLPFGDPSFDSGWVDLTPGFAQIVTHSLGGDTDDYVVYLEGRSSLSGDRHRAFGSDRTEVDVVTGFYWTGLNTSAISLFRQEDDSSTDQARVRIWVVSTADYDSDWQVATSGEVNLTHNVGGDTDDYVVYMEMRSFYSEVNQAQYGRDRFRDAGGTVRHMGAYWHNLTSSTVDIFRGSFSSHADDVRLRIWRKPAPDYDSGWFDISRAEYLTKNHNLGGPWNDFVVDVQFKDTGVDGNGINHRSYGMDRYWDSGNSRWVWYGGHWHELTSSSIELYRAANDNDADRMRVRIWVVSAPKYDSGWQALSQNSGQYLSHNIGGDADAYHVDLQFRDTTYGVNHVNYGCDFQWTGSRRYDYGADWSLLTSSQIYVHRYADDSSAEEVRVRIWVAPFPDFTSGWEVITPGSTAPFFDSGGPDSVIALDQKDGSTPGINARFTGIDRYSTDGSNLKEMGTQWRAVDGSHVTIYRGLDDTYADEARVRMWRPPISDYDSGWVSVDPGTLDSWSHNLGARTDDMVVELHFSGYGWINGIGYGSDNYWDGSSVREGGYWRSLTESTIAVRREEDAFDASQIRARIWTVSSDLIFEDGFESGNASAWSSSTP